MLIFMNHYYGHSNGIGEEDGRSRQNTVILNGQQGRSLETWLGSRVHSPVGVLGNCPTCVNKKL